MLTLHRLLKHVGAGENVYLTEAEMSDVLLGLGVEGMLAFRHRMSQEMKARLYGIPVHPTPDGYILDISCGKCRGKGAEL
ncbi:MAG: hypothetical protein ACE5EX_06415 [Phycisphaerae bacterium]